MNVKDDGRVARGGGGGRIFGGGVCGGRWLGEKRVKGCDGWRNRRGRCCEEEVGEGEGVMG